MIILSLLIGCNVHGAIGVNYYKLNAEEFRIYVGNAFILIFVISGALLLISGFVSQSISSLLHFPADWLQIVIITALSTYIFNITIAIWQVASKPWAYGFYQIFYIATNILLSLTFVVYFHYGWEGRVLGIFISSVIFAIVGMALLYKNGYLKFSAPKKEYVKDMLQFGLPLLLHSMGGWSMIAVDRLLITALVGVAATGGYTVGYQIGAAVDFLCSSFNCAYVPFVFKRLSSDDPGVKHKLVKFTYIYFAAILALAIGLGNLAPFIFKYFVGEEFYSSYQYIKWIALGGAFNGMYYMVVLYIFYIKKTGVLARITFLTGALNVPVTYFLIRQSGPIGAAQAMAIISFITFALVWIYSAKAFPMPWFNIKNSSLKNA